MSSCPNPTRPRPRAPRLATGPLPPPPRLRWNRRSCSGHDRTARSDRSFGGVPQCLSPQMSGRSALTAMIGIGADEQPPTMVVGDDLIEVGISGAAQPAGVWRVDGAERMVLEVERLHARPRRNGVEALLAAGAE